MSPIPDDHPAARDLKRQFAALDTSEDRATAKPKAKGPVPARRVVGLSLGTLAVLATAAGATKVFVVNTHLIGGDPDAPADVRKIPADRRLSPVRVADPDGGLAWGVRTYVSSTGDTCAVVGRVRGANLGTVNRGDYRPLAASAPGACQSPDHLLLAARSYLGAAPRTVVFGVAPRDVRALTLVRGARSVRVAIAQDGVFLIVRPRAGALEGATLRVQSTRGTTTRRLR